MHFSAMSLFSYPHKSQGEAWNCSNKVYKHSCFLIRCVKLPFLIEFYNWTFSFIVGTAGALHRISGSFGKGLAILTFDDEYQKKRQEGLNKKPANIGEGLLRGVKGLGTVIMKFSKKLKPHVSLRVKHIKNTF